MQDFKDLLKAKTDDVQPPVPLPVGRYEAEILSWQTGHSSRKQTPFVSFAVKLTAPTDDVDEEEFQEFGGMAEVAAKVYDVPFYLTDKARFMLANTFRSIGLPGKKTLEQNCASMVGLEVIATVQHEQGENGIFARIRGLSGSEVA